MKTICVNCGAVLTDEHGRRLLSGEFDSRLPAVKPTRSLIYARCAPCHMAAVAIRIHRAGKVQP